MKFSGNLALLKNQAKDIELTAGENISISNGDTISTVHIPTFGDVLLDTEQKLVTELLDEKYSIQPNLNLEPNKITLNLGTIEGVQITTIDSQVANKAYIDQLITHLWEQLQNFNYLSFKGEFNPNLTYKMGDMVFSDSKIYVSLTDLNNEPLTNTNAWQLIANAFNGDLVTAEQLTKALTLLANEINTKNNEQDNRITTNQTAIGLANEAITALQNKSLHYEVMTTNFFVEGNSISINGQNKSSNYRVNWPTKIIDFINDGWIIVNVGVYNTTRWMAFSIVNYRNDCFYVDIINLSSNSYSFNVNQMDVYVRMIKVSYS